MFKPNNIYRQYLIQPQYLQLLLEEHVHTCRDWKFPIFPFLKVTQEILRWLLITKFKRLHCTENHIFFFRSSCKDGLSKKIWSFLYYQERRYFFFPKIWSYTLDRKWKMIFLKKYTEVWYFLQTFWKDALSKKGRAGTWSFLFYLERWYFFPENIFFSLCRKWKMVFLRKYMETWSAALQRRKTGNLIYRIEVWLLFKFIRLEIFYNE